ncbi:MAG: hypothetical protein ACT4RN_03330 [Pseudonocardia sp.]
MTDPTAGLPPVPDPAGDPRPPEQPPRDPHRPLPTISRRLDPADADSRWRLGPADEPPLELALVPPAQRRRDALLATGYFAALLLLVSAFVGWGDPDRWLAALAFFGVCLLPLYGWLWWISDVHGWIVAGGRWVAGGAGGGPQRGSRRGVDAVRVYALVEVSLGRPLDRVEPLVLRLGDPEGAVGLEVDLLLANPALWALVYNGILHSEARGARIDDRTREFLRLNPA